MRRKSVVPNRIFLAYPWQSYRQPYEEVCTRLHSVFPVYFYAIGRPAGQPAQALLERIKGVLLSSSAAIFDASKGNPNVSLEYGMAHFTEGLPTYLFIDEATRPEQVNTGTPIISDLAGATQNTWHLRDNASLMRHLRAIAENHDYTHRFRRYCRDRGLVRGQFRRPLKIIRMFDERESMLRREVLDRLRAQWPRVRHAALEALLADLHQAGLITISRGREWASKVSITD